MLKTQTGSVPCWRLVDVPKFGSLSSNIVADVCIVGAGISGLSAAYLLTKAGRKVVVVDSASVAGGQTERTTAHLTSVLDKRYHRLQWLHGEEGARLAAHSHQAAIEQIQRIASEEQIDCDFARVDGYLFNGPGESSDTLEKEAQAARRAGLQVEFVERAPWSGFDTGRCLRFPNQAQFHPVKYLRALATAVVRNGGRIFAQTQVKSIADDTPTRVQTTAQCEIKAGATIVATHTPINDRFKIHTKQAPYRTYVIGLSVPRSIVPLGLYWDTADPYHYVRLHPSFDALMDRDLLIVGGEDHKTGQERNPELCYTRLEQWTRERFPMAGYIDFRWSGQVMEPNDGLAYIGPNPGDKNVYIVTGTSGNGLTYGTIAGMLLSDLILGRANPWAEIYKPARVSLRATGEFLAENLNVANWYTDHLTRSEVDSPDKIAPVRGPSSVADCPKWRSFATRMEISTSVRQSVRTWAASCTGTKPRTRGIVLSTAHASLPWAA